MEDQEQYCCYFKILFFFCCCFIIRLDVGLVMHKITQLQKPYIRYEKKVSQSSQTLP